MQLHLNASRYIVLNIHLHSYNIYNLYSYHYFRLLFYSTSVVKAAGRLTSIAFTYCYGAFEVFRHYYVGRDNVKSGIDWWHLTFTYLLVTGFNIQHTSGTANWSRNENSNIIVMKRIWKCLDMEILISCMYKGFLNNKPWGFYYSLEVEVEYPTSMSNEFYSPYK